MRYRTAILIFICIIHWSGNAQDLQGLINAFNSKISGEKLKHMQGSVWTLDTGRSNEETLSGKVELWQADVSCYYKFLQIEMVQNDKYLLQVDHEDRSIMMFQAQRSPELLEHFSPTAVSAFLEQADTVRPIYRLSDCHGFRIEYGTMDDGLEAIEVFYRKLDGSLREVKFYYKFYDWVTDIRTRYEQRIVYELWEFPQKVPVGVFTLNDKIEIKGKSIRPLGVWSDYGLWVDPALSLSQK